MVGFLRRFLRQQAGATAIEYSLIGAGVALAIITSLALYADSASVLLDRTMTAIAQALSGASNDG